jgi:two-component system response regulator YesN
VLTLRILICDDEEIVREGLRDAIDWKGLGIDEVALAKNGLDALELFMISIPDILLTDVRMPKMNGIDLAEAVRKRFPKCKILFMSGFSDKEYLISALHVGALGYIEKPILIEELRAAIESAVSVFRKDQERADEEDRLRRHLSISDSLIRREVARDLLLGSDGLDTSDARFERVLADWSTCTYFQAITMLLMKDDTITTSDAISNNRSILDRINGAEWHEWRIVASDDGPWKLILIAARIDAPSNEQVDTLLDDLKSKLKGPSGNRIACAIGMGVPFERIERIRDSFLSSAISPFQLFYEGYGGTLQQVACVDMRERPEYEANVLKELTNAIGKHDFKTAKDIVDHVTNDIRNNRYHDMYFIRNLYFRINQSFLSRIAEAGLLDSSSRSQSYEWVQIERFDTLQSLHDHTISNIMRISSIIDEKEEMLKRIADVYVYIRANIGNQEMSIRSIADNVFLTPAYLCSYFKKATGKTIFEYITDERIRMAKQLLSDSCLKQYEIARSIGLKDVNYFTVLFKKETGITPSEYRKRSHAACG